MNNKKVTIYYKTEVNADHIFTSSQAIFDFLAKNPPEFNLEIEKLSLRLKKFKLLMLLQYLTNSLSDYLETSLPRKIPVTLKGDEILILAFYDAVDLVKTSSDDSHAIYCLEKIQQMLISLWNRIENERLLNLQKN